MSGIFDRSGGLDRRALLSGSLAAAALSALPGPAVGAAPGAGRSPATTLTAGKARLPIVGPPHPMTDVWCYNAVNPGPVLRARQGSQLNITVRNRLAEPTSVHWHGLRVANEMDGVPYITQAPIAPGKDFHYALSLPDAGTYWYHPHVNGSEQVGRGLAGALVVEEANPPRVDRDLIWVLDDWRLTRRAAIADDFGHRHDLSHAGRLGNTVTINGRLPSQFTVRAGERIRLRLVNVANARTFGLKFEGHAPRIVALDGQPVSAHEPPGGTIVLAAGQRADVILDATGKPGAKTRVLDAYYRRNAYKLIDLVYAKTPLRPATPDWPFDLAKNPLAAPRLKSAQRHEILIEGGAMGGRITARGVQPMHRDAMWAIDGGAMMETAKGWKPILTLKRGSSHILRLDNRTVFDHPMHLHGHSFRVIARNDKPTVHGEWRDTVMVRPRETVEIAFVADNPGNWMFHCHILEHMQAGMMAVIRVS
ncbi:MAG: multicopper oxidase family protein [Alphaproteobacteria bacterium]